MKINKLSSLEIYNKFTENKTPSFKEGINGYTFCSNIIYCSGCDIKYLCARNRPNLLEIPRINKKEYKSIIKKHPEHLL